MIGWSDGVHDALGDDVEPLRVFITDDHPVFRAGLRLLLEAQEGTEVVGEAATGADAIAAATSYGGRGGRTGRTPKCVLNVARESVDMGRERYCRFDGFYVLSRGPGVGPRSARRRHHRARRRAAPPRRSPAR